VKIERRTLVGVDKQGREIIATDPRLGRIASLDERSRNYPARDLLESNQQTPRGRRWYLKLQLDQGQTGDCTGFSRTYDLAASPQPLKQANGKPFDDNFAHALCTLAKKYDEWPGEAYEGSSVLGAFKAAKALGFIGEYRWAFSIDDLVLALSYLGPVVVGTDWLDSMFDVGSNGLVEVDTTSSVAGGHAYVFNQVVLNRTTMRSKLGKGVPIREGDILLSGQQSWGSDWGANGRYLFWASDLEKLLEGVDSPGEAAISTVALHR
jgi:hypothetical protein